MPELPEVETLRRSLKPHLLGAVVSGAEFFRPDILEIEPGADPVAFTVGAEITGLARRGKYLLVQLGHSRGWAVHFGMSGTMIHYPPGLAPVDEHTHVMWDLGDRGQVCYRAPRRFGRWIMSGSDVSAALGDRVGTDALDPDLDGSTLRALLGESRSPIKCRLLDQRRVAGLGNIYVDEALFCAGIDPTRRTSSLEEAQWEDLFLSMRRVLTQAIEHRGTTFSTYRDGQGREGENARHLAVYGRAGQECPRCAASIERSVVGGRGTHHCPSCQN